VNLYPKAASGCCDTFGNVWDWVEDHFNGIPGFSTSEYYDDFSSPCFDGKHNMILVNMFFFFQFNFFLKKRRYLVVIVSFNFRGF